VVNTLNGRGALAWNHPLRLGTVTDIPDFWQLMATADLVIAVGTRFQAAATGQWSMPTPKSLVQIDVEERSIGRAYAADATVIGDAEQILDALRSATPRSDGDPDFIATAGELRRRLEERFRVEAGEDYAAIVEALGRHVNTDTPVAADACMVMAIAARRLLPVHAPRRAIGPTSGAIGPGLPLAIGAALGVGRRTILLQGDGGFMLSIGELATVAEHHLPITICVFNDRGYGAIRMVSHMAYGREIASDLGTPDLCSLAASFGISATRVDSADSLAAALDRAAAASGPFLIDIDLCAMPSTSPVLWRQRSTAPRPPGT
jgi:acetolactate synthase-1/2/3 large subunit